MTKGHTCSSISLYQLEYNYVILYCVHMCTHVHSSNVNCKHDNLLLHVHILSIVLHIYTCLSQQQPPPQARWPHHSISSIATLLPCAHAS